MEEESIFDLPRERLDLIDHDVYKWVCCAFGCDRGTHVRDYGEAPMYFVPLKKMSSNPWRDSCEWYWMCGKHNKMEKRGLRYTMKVKPLMMDNLVFVKSITVTDLKLHE